MNLLLSQSTFGLILSLIDSPFTNSGPPLDLKARAITNLLRQNNLLYMIIYPTS